MSTFEDWGLDSAIDREGGVDGYRESLTRRAGQESTRTKTQSLYDMIDTPKRQQNSLRFPYDLGFEGSDNIIRFNVNVPSGSNYIGAEAGNAVVNPRTGQEGEPEYETSRVRRETQGTISSRFKGNVVRTDTVIDMFLPPSIQASYSAKWNAENLGTTGAGIDAGFGLAGEGGISGAAQATWNTLKAAAPSIGSRALDMIARTNTQAAQRAVTGTVVNPYMEMTFEGVDARSFNFIFKMIPRNVDEQHTVRDIVKTFKFHQAPEVKFEGQSNYWTFPSEFDITFLYRGEENPWVHKISTCALTGVQVEYTAEGQYTSHEDGSPFSTTLTLSFQEMELLTKDRILAGY